VRFCPFMLLVYSACIDFFLQKTAVTHTSGRTDINSRWQDYCFKVIKNGKKNKKNPIARCSREACNKGEIDFSTFRPTTNAVYISCGHIIIIIYVYYYMRKCRVSGQFIIVGRPYSPARATIIMVYGYVVCLRVKTVCFLFLSLGNENKCI